jgi:hypothetical protein
MREKLWRAAGLTLLGTLAGCASTSMPSLSHPGPAGVQQKRAVKYDPWPESVGAADMSTVRPREYQNPPVKPPQGIPIQ